MYFTFFQLREENEQLRRQLTEAQELARRQSDRLFVDCIVFSILLANYANSYHKLPATLLTGLQENATASFAVASQQWSFQLGVQSD